MYMPGKVPNTTLCRRYLIADMSGEQNQAQNGEKEGCRQVSLPLPFSCASLQGLGRSRGPTNYRRALTPKAKPPTSLFSTPFASGYTYETLVPPELCNLKEISQCTQAFSTLNCVSQDDNCTQIQAGSICNFAN